MCGYLERKESVLLYGPVNAPILGLYPGSNVKFKSRVIGSVKTHVTGEKPVSQEQGMCPPMTKSLAMC